MQGPLPDPRAETILALVLQMVPRPGGVAVGPNGDALDEALDGLGAIAEELARARATAKETERRLEELNEVIVALVSFDYEKKAPVSEENNVLDGMAVGLNMLGEELSFSTVSKGYLDSVLESMSDLLVVVDPDGVIGTVNQAACELTGYTREELIGRPMTLLFSGASVDELLAAGGERDRDRACAAKGGRAVPVSFSASILRGGAGEVRGLVCVARDVTESALAEQERWRLQEAVQRQAILLQELSTPLIPITSDILVMPIIGTLDAARSARITEALLDGIAARKTRAAILDITGLREVDGTAVEGLLRAAHGARLLGSNVVLTGVSPRVAKALVQMEGGLHDIVSFGTLERGIAHAMAERAAARPAR